MKKKEIEEADVKIIYSKELLEKFKGKLCKLIFLRDDGRVWNIKGVVSEVQNDILFYKTLVSEYAIEINKLLRILEIKEDEENGTTRNS